MKITVPHLDGRGIVVEVPAGSVRHGATQTVAGEGMPIRKKPGTKGDMIVKFDVEAPG